MRFYTGQHRYYCGVDLHARTMDLCILDRESGEVMLHRNVRCEPQALLLTRARTYLASALPRLEPAPLESAGTTPHIGFWGAREASPLPPRQLPAGRPSTGVWCRALRMSSATATRT